MKAHLGRVVIALTSAGLALSGAATAMAMPTALTDGQLDRVTAGTVSVVSSTGAGATGNFTLAGTNTSAVVSGGAPNQQPGMTDGGGLADGAAFAVGNNFGLGGAPPTAFTNVQTAGGADGNLVIQGTVNNTIQGAGGLVLQTGFTYAFGIWMKL